MRCAMPEDELDQVSGGTILEPIEQKSAAQIRTVQLDNRHPDNKH